MFRTTSAAILVTAITLSACTSNEAATTTTSGIVTTTAVPTTTAVAPTTTTTPLDPTTTTLRDGAVGSREALLEAMQPALDSSEVLFGIDKQSVPVPNLNDPDPLVALEALIEFDFWVFSNATTDSWAGVLAVPDSPNWSEYLSGFNSLAGRVAVFDAGEAKPFEIIELRLATEDEIAQVPTEVLSAAGADSVVALERLSLAPHTLRVAGRPELDLERTGYAARETITVLTPTEIGWQYYWDSE